MRIIRICTSETWESGGNWCAHCARRESEIGTAWTKNRHQSLSSCFLLGSTGCFYLFMALSVAHPHVPFLFFACSCTVDESRSRFLSSKLKFLCKGIFFFFFCKNSQLCIMIQMRRRNTPSFITAWEHRRVQWVDRIFAFVYIGEKNAGSLVSFGYWKYLLQPSLSDSWALKKAVTSCLVPYVHTPTPTAICDRWCLNSLKYWCKHCVYMN